MNAYRLSYLHDKSEFISHGEVLSFYYIIIMYWGKSSKDVGLLLFEFNSVFLIPEWILYISSVKVCWLNAKNIIMGITIIVH